MENLVEIKNEQIITTSRQVAENFGKRHDKLLFEIERMYSDYIVLEGAPKMVETPLFYKTTYKHEQNGQQYSMYLMNRDGFSLLVMGFTGKEALQWKIRYIEAFNAMEEKLKSKPMSQLEIVAYNAQVLVDHEKKLNEIAQRQESQAHELQDMRDVITLSSVSWRKDVASIINSIAQQLGGYEHIRDVRAESYRLLDERMQVNVHTRLTNMRRRMAENGVCKSKRDKLNQLDVIAEDKKLVEGYLAIIKDMAIKNGVAAPERLGA